MALMMHMQYTDLCLMSTVNRLYHRLGFRRRLRRALDCSALSFAS